MMETRNCSVISDRSRLSAAGIIVFTLLILFGCAKGEPPMNANNVAQEISENRLEKLRSLRMYFGHQSVGSNLLEGLQDLAALNPSYKLNIVETDAPENISGPLFAHFRVGSNMTPDSKIASFRDHILKSGASVDVAFFKFCYVDVTADTDSKALFQKYQASMVDLKRTFPKLTFVHVTIPLKTIDGGIKGMVKKVLGKSVGEEANVKRTHYNELLRKEYAGKDPIFDLAAFESTTPDGARIQGVKNGAGYEALYPPYSDDGEHLNREGRRRAALALMQTFAAVADQLPK